MKKVVLFLAVVMSIAVSSHATENRKTQSLSDSTNEVVVCDVNMGLVFRTTQNLCCGRDQMILYRSGSFELYQNQVEVYSGTYSIDTENNVVVLYVGDKKLRCKFYYKSDGQNISYLTFGNDRFTPCNR